MLQQAAILLTLLALSSLAWALAHRRDGRFRPSDGPAAPLVTAADLGIPTDGRSTFVLISSATCSTCPQVRRVLADVASADPDVACAELPAEEHMDLVRRLGVLRTPTVLLLDRAGTLRSRTSGPLRPDQARAALSALTTTPARS